MKKKLIRYKLYRCDSQLVKDKICKYYCPKNYLKHKKKKTEKKKLNKN